MAESLFVKKLNELIESGAKAAAPGVTAAIKDVDALGQPAKPTEAKKTGLPSFPIPPASAKLLKPEELKYLNGLPLDKRPSVPMVGTIPNYDDKSFQTAYKTLLFDFRDAESKRKKEAAGQAAMAQ